MQLKDIMERRFLMIYALVAFSHLSLETFALPAVQEPISSDNATLNDDTNVTVTTLTSSTIAPTIKSRPSKEPTEIEGKFKSLGCNVPMLTIDVKVWRNNQTHELLLPTKLEDCRLCDDDQLEWDGFIEIQSGDVLLVKIDDSYLIHPEVVFNESQEDTSDSHGSSSEPPTAVYQVTRQGHDHCDVTEGNLLDITPQKIDGHKVVTLYDKDLTDGINLLIVVSPAWGNRCVRLKVTMKSDNCGDSRDCSGKGVCYSNVSMEGYECQCCPGFVGPHCEEQDACYPSPCKNSGICVDISQGIDGSAYQCLCPYGFSGRTCQDEADPCTSMPCQNGASCFGNITEFRCECPEGFAGLLCQHNLDGCKSSPCINGICVDREDGFKCFCEPGFTGDLCEYDYNECSSSPCMNGGTCTDGHGSYTCSCGRGFTGKRCHITVDLCEPNPCPEPQYCENHGNNYSCECPKGFSGPDCRTPSRAACSVNPCLNGGTCWSSMHTFYCACRPGFTGKTCETEFIGETITSVDMFSTKDDLEIHFYHLDHLHNAYIAAGTLASACIIVALIVTVCHCRLNKTYKRFLLRARPLWKLKGRRAAPQPTVPNNTEWFSGKDKAPTATPSRNLPSLDTADMYYTLDFSDSQSSPLIQ